jgi:hypothetical protein
MHGLVVASVLVLALSISAAEAAKKKKAKPSSLKMEYSEQQLKEFYRKLSSAAVCDGVKKFFAIPSASGNCDNLTHKFSKGEGINIKLSRSSPGLRRFAMEVVGSSERLSINRPRATQSHKYEIIFMLDFDMSPYVHVFDMEARLSLRTPDTARDESFILMGREYDSQNFQFQSRLASAIADHLSGLTDIPVEIANTN